MVLRQKPPGPTVGPKAFNLDDPPVLDYDGDDKGPPKVGSLTPKKVGPQVAAKGFDPHPNGSNFKVNGPHGMHSATEI